MLLVMLRSKSQSEGGLVFVKAVHTAIWGFMVACIFAIWISAGRGETRAALIFSGVVSVEVAIILLNGGHCPLTKVAKSLAGDAYDGSDIYLPNGLARHTKSIFGSLYAGGVVFTLWRWVEGPS
jgi:hypothetical protein